MACFRNFSDGTVEQTELKEKNNLQQSTRNSSRLPENPATNMEEIAEPTTSYNAGENNSSNVMIGNTQPPTRRTAMGGRWGASIWKDCQPTMTSHKSSESGEESKSGSEYRGSEAEEESDGADDRMESGTEDSRHKELRSKGNHIVSADEMLSDEYYEQDGDNPSESLNHRGPMNHSSRHNSKPPSRSAASSSISSKSKALKTNRYNDEDADYEDGEEEDEDDPDDADFDPDFGGMRGRRGIKMHQDGGHKFEQELV